MEKLDVYSAQHPPAFNLENRIVRPNRDFSVPEMEKEGKITFLWRCNTNDMTSIFAIAEYSGQLPKGSTRALDAYSHHIHDGAASRGVVENLPFYRKEAGIIGTEFSLLFSYLMAHDLQQTYGYNSARVMVPEPFMAKNRHLPAKVLNAVEQSIVYEDTFGNLPIIPVPFVSLGEPHLVNIQGEIISFLSACYDRKNFQDIFPTLAELAARTMTSAMKVLDMLPKEREDRIKQESEAKRFLENYFRALENVDSVDVKPDLNALKLLNQEVSSDRYDSMGFCAEMGAAGNRMDPLKKKNISNS